MIILSPIAAAELDDESFENMVYDNIVANNRGIHDDAIDEKDKKSLDELSHVISDKLSHMQIQLRERIRPCTFLAC